MNVGKVENYTRSCNFPFEDCPNRRLLVWNEINFMDSAIDTNKMLLGGDQFSTKIKYMSDVTIFRTPVIVMQNPPRVLKDKAFADRCFAYNWQPCPKLKDISRYPHPMVLTYLYWKLQIHNYDKENNFFFESIDDDEKFKTLEIYHDFNI